MFPCSALFWGLVFWLSGPLSTLTIIVGWMTGRLVLLPPVWREAMFMIMTPRWVSYTAQDDHQELCGTPGSCRVPRGLVPLCACISSVSSETSWLGTLLFLAPLVSAPWASLHQDIRSSSHTFPIGRVLMRLASPVLWGSFLVMLMAPLGRSAPKTLVLVALCPTHPHDLTLLV